MLRQTVLWDQDLDSSVAEFILSGAEGLLRNDMGRFEEVLYHPTGNRFCTEFWINPPIKKGDIGGFES